MKSSGLSSAARYIVFHCYDDFGGTQYYESVDLVDAFHPQTMIAWARAEAAAGRADLVAIFPRYHPGWAHWMAGIPVIREFVVWNLVIVLRRPI